MNVELTPQPPSARLGWISPDGDFYPCAYAAHKYLARLLGKKFIGNPMREISPTDNRYWHPKMWELYNLNPNENLFLWGWAQIYQGGVTLSYGCELTEAQRRVVFEIAKSFEHVYNGVSKDFDNLVLENPEEYEMENVYSDPSEYCLRPLHEELMYEIRGIEVSELKRPGFAAREVAWKYRTSD